MPPTARNNKPRIIKLRINRPTVAVFAAVGDPADPFWTRIDALARACGAVLYGESPCCGGGTLIGANVRDQEYEFPTTDDAERFALALAQQIGVMPDADASRTVARIRRIIALDPP